MPREQKTKKKGISKNKDKSSVKGGSKKDTDLLLTGGMPEQENEAEIRDTFGTLQTRESPLYELMDQ